MSPTSPGPAHGAESTDLEIPTKAATIYDVAKAAGVSHQTVSRYLSGYAGIRPQTRERVEQALAFLDYRPNRSARTLRTGRSQRLVALTHQIDQFGPRKIVQGASVAARDLGYVLDILSLDLASTTAVESALESVQASECDGVLVLTATDEMSHALRHAHFDVPAVTADEADDGLAQKPTQLSTAGFPALVSHLDALGHRRIAHISGPAGWSASRNRVRGLQAALRAADLPEALILEGDWSAASAHRLTTRLLDTEAVTAIVAANDQMALGAILAVTQRGLRVPHDISVTGVDDIPEAAYICPPLTTLRIDFGRQGHDAVRRLMAVMRGAKEPILTSQHSQLIVRESTGAARE
ncbi:LacI family DNA-binding transcriptional regulator [Kineococcus aurantiacus]|uniref:LacI family transcriptional regulator n=1 Tax=Kineococcus aurantiacus TaxID=37633 RepID=A0A7Y9J3L1_9ACTN|nr:LacI family DNA-binding transcriptional regulator [Kineococcus aurantiacus]NYD25103.1 LacI family transcriptional regulator [Kineococcus aurantiacus]